MPMGDESRRRAQRVCREDVSTAKGKIPRAESRAQRALRNSKGLEKESTKRARGRVVSEVSVNTKLRYSR